MALVKHKASHTDNVLNLAHLIHFILQWQVNKLLAPLNINCITYIFMYINLTSYFRID